MYKKRKYTALIIEPRAELEIPYRYLANYKFNLIRFTTLQRASLELKQTLPDLVLLSTSFSISKLVNFLELLKNTCTIKLIPLIFVIDLKKPISKIPGTTWGKKIVIAHSLFSPKEMLISLDKLMKP
ncbi:MAG: hypothetical protein PVJ09_00590 [Candidatus Woesebacteria bacterium]|jgi:hypothetical protein